jgi:tetratricopeptide (TPR) repeat protein
MHTTLRRSSLLLTAIIMLMVIQDRIGAQTATVREDRQAFRTYPFGDPNPVARMGNIYPYFRFEGYNASPVMKKWNVITLENSYIKVLIAPEIGGKILGAFEKSTGKPFIYFNKVVKFREIAMRGPWTSGGVEFNFGDIGHAPSTACPVDYTTRINPDGSASCIVGTIDLPSRTEWRVEIRLPKDKAYVEARSFWYNPTELPTSLYHWMNAAAEADSDLYFIYPGTAHIDHGGISSSWPVNPEGRDLSLYRNNAFGPSKSYHVLGTYTDFFGLGWKNRDFGVIHWADYTEKPGKKLWLWALSREGDIWTDLLTDTDLGNTQYVEFQSGLLFNQVLPQSTLTPFKHRTFGPFSEERFTEAWFPFKKTGGAAQANLHGVLNVEHHGPWLVFSLCPLEKLGEDLIVTAGEKEVYRKKVNLNSMQAFVDSIQAPTNVPATVTVGSLLAYRDTDAASRELERPRETNKAFDWTSAEGLAVDAVEKARSRDYDVALQKYSQSLQKDSLYTPALSGAAEVFFRRMEYDQALAYVRKALANDAYDPATNFLYGVIQRQRGRLYDAMDGFGNAARSTEYRSAANTALAEIAVIQGLWAKAIGYSERATDYDRYNIRALRARAIAYRKLGRSKEASRVQEDILSIDPLAHFVRMERFIADPGEQTKQTLESAIHTELPAEVYLELAAYYYDMGLPQDALQALSSAPAHPIVYYWKAYLSDKLGFQSEAEANLRNAAQCSYHFVFPFRTETAEVLQWAQSRSGEWTIRYFLGLILWSKGRLDDARSLMASCETRPADAPFYITRGNLFKGVNDSMAMIDYKQGVQRGPDEWRSHYTLASFCNERGYHVGALLTLNPAQKRFPDNYVLQFELAKTLLSCKRYLDCLALLDTLRILPFEGAGYGRELHRQAAVLASVQAIREGKNSEALALVARAREWPEQLGVGKPYDVDSRMEDLLEGVCRQRQGDSASATKLLQAVVKVNASEKQHDAQYVLHLLALRRLGRNRDAIKALDAWASLDSTSNVVHWALGVFPRDSQTAPHPHLSMESPATTAGKPVVPDPDFPIIKEIASISLE